MLPTSTFRKFFIQLNTNYSHSYAKKKNVLSISVVSSGGIQHWIDIFFQSLQKDIFGWPYITCIIGNVSIIVLVKTHPNLHVPMYFFISLFAVSEIMFVSVTIPKLLAILSSGDTGISAVGCFIQVYALHALGETECLLLALMAVDRYLAINNPLHYSTIMNFGFGAFPWIAGLTISFIPAIFTFFLDYCGPNEIDQVFCDMAPLQNLACSNPLISSYAIIASAIITVIFPFITIVVIYINIIIVVLKINNKEGKKKAFSTCSSHLIVACLFYGSVIIVYIRPKGSHYDKFLSLMYTVVTPMLNPYIYTLRNTEVKQACRKIMRRLLKQV
ncbi:olfactory receptor 10A3-like [Gastrophryne carolinensis]